MGGNCGSQAKQADDRSLEVRFAAAGYTPPFSVDYENNFEKELFYAITLLRANPSSFERHA